MRNMSKPCEVIQDLLPLYVDEACSESSVEIIKEHLESCPECREIYQQLHSHTSEEILQKEKDGVISRHSRKLRKGKILTVIFSVILTLIIVFTCVSLCPASIDYGTSDIYSRQDMTEAIDLIKEEFNSWDGCKLYSINYTDDDLCQRELEYCNTLAEEGITYDECIVFRMQFRSPIFGGGGWNENFRYDWSWYLARTKGGEWELLTWGAP